MDMTNNGSLSFGAMTLAQLRTSVRNRADMNRPDINGVPQSVCSDSEVNDYINCGVKGLADILINHFGEEYFVSTPYQFTTDGINEHFPLPFDLYKALGVDLQICGGNPAQWIPIHPFNFAERNKYTIPAAPGFAMPPRTTNLRYRISDQTIWLRPQPASGAVFQVHYIPFHPYLADLGTLDLTRVQVGDTLLLNGVTYQFTNGSPTPGNVAVAVGGTTSTTVANLVAAIGTHDTTVTLSDARPLINVIPASGTTKVVWDATTGIDLTPGPGAWMYRTTSKFTPWIEYVINEAVIRCKNKEDGDIQLEVGVLRQDLAESIESAAYNRDAGGPLTVTDVRSGDLPWGFGGGW